MDFLFINSEELSAMRGLPHSPQLAYLLGLRPFMDRKTFMVGIKRRISYQSLSEALYVEPHQGIQSGSPSREQLRRVIKGLERAGLVRVQSSDRHLILKCVLADARYSVQNKADIPHNPENNNIFLCKKFGTFWAGYPQPKNKLHAKKIFETLNPDDLLFAKILSALKAQAQYYQQLKAARHWIANWKYPANWLAQACWNAGLITTNALQSIRQVIQNNPHLTCAGSDLTTTC